MGKDNFLSQLDCRAAQPTHYIAGTKLTIKNAINKSNLVQVSSLEIKRGRCSAYNHLVR